MKQIIVNMNENLDLVKILKDCSKGTKLYSPLFGDVFLSEVKEECEYPIIIETTLGDESTINNFNSKGLFFNEYEGECLLFPSKDQRDWGKFKCPKFDPKTLQPFDKVITKCDGYPWKCDIFSYCMKRGDKSIACYCTSEDYIYDKCIPYNDDTKHLVGTSDEAPEFYRYWEE